MSQKEVGGIQGPPSPVTPTTPKPKPTVGPLQGAQPVPAPAGRKLAAARAEAPLAQPAEDDGRKDVHPASESAIGLGQARAEGPGTVGPSPAGQPDGSAEAQSAQASVRTRRRAIQADLDRSGREAAQRMRDAVAFELKRNEKRTPAEYTIEGEEKPQPGDEIGDSRKEGKDPAPTPTPILGVDDRTPHMAMAAIGGTPTRPPPQPRRQSTIAALRPKSRAECERRCGPDGFCDPSNPLGCGGVYCGQRYVRDV